VAGDNKQQHRPQENPGNSQITYSAGDAVGILRRLWRRSLSSFAASSPTPVFSKPTLNAFVAEERALDVPEDLRHETAAQIGLLHIHVKQPVPLVMDSGL
jgi:hypothetical protein